MDLREMGQVVMFVNSLERRAMTEDEVVATALAWHELIGDLPYEDVRVAIKEHFMETADGRYFRPGDVAYRARRIGDRRRARPWGDREREIAAAQERRRLEAESAVAHIEAGPGESLADIMRRVEKTTTKEIK